MWLATPAEKVAEVVAPGHISGFQILVYFVANLVLYMAIPFLIFQIAALLCNKKV